MVRGVIRSVRSAQRRAGNAQAFAEQAQCSGALGQAASGRAVGDAVGVWMLAGLEASLIGLGFTLV